MQRLTMTLVALAVLAGAVWAQPGRLPATKKLIEYGWDVPEPAFVRDNIAAMEKRPFDGLIMRVAGKGRGNVFSGGKWDPKDYAADMAAMPAIKWGKFKHNFLMMYSASEQDWFSDKDWANVLSNVTIMAKCAKAGGCSLAFDAEPYGTNPWGYTGQKWAKEKSYAEYAAKARQRGRQFIKAIGKVLPGNTLLTFFTFSLFGGEMDLQDPAKLADALKQNGYGLYLPFLQGVLEGMGPKMTITDGNEPSYYYGNSEAFLAAFHMMRQRALNLVPRELATKFATQAQVSQALYMDYVFNRVPWPNIPAKFMTPDEQAKWFEHNVYWALKTTDEYVWLYSEKMNWWKNTDIPEGMEQAIVRARDAIANHRGLGFDMRDRMKQIEDRRKAEIDTKLLRRTAAVKVVTGTPAPVIDGKLSDAVWQRATLLEPFVGQFGTKPEDLKAKTRASVAYDTNALYIAIHADEPLVAKMDIAGTAHDDPVWNGDSFDVFITAEASGSPYVHLILSPKNVQWDARYDTDNDMTFDPKWQSGTEIGTDFWAAEIAIPWAELKITPRPGLKLRANLCRQRRAASELSCWSQTVGGFMESDHFGTWELR